jgi:uncharacterized protein (TIGR02246 family)
MTANPLTRRTFLAGAAAAATAHAASKADPLPEAVAKTFISRWDTAWNNHDAKALGLLHTEDAVTVNRFGTFLHGRGPIEGALAFLHGSGGPFHSAVFPRQQLILVRQPAPDVVIVQTTWKNPIMNPDGKIDPVKTNDMIVTFMLVRREPQWQAAEVNLQNVEKMDLPFSNAGQKP